MLDQIYRELVQKRLNSVCVPLAYEIDGQESSVVRGTGSLFDLDGHIFLITAEHVLQGVNFNKIGVPVYDPVRPISVNVDENGKPYYLEGASIATLGKGEIHSIESIDLAFCELLNEKVISVLRENYIFLGYDCLGEPTRQGNIVVAGWANSLAVKVGNRTAQKLFYFETQLTHTPEKTDQMEAIEPYDFFMPYDEIEEIGGAPREAFNLHGISGGAVWQIDPAIPRDRLWTAGRAMKFVGVEKSVLKGQFIKGTKVAAIPYLFESIDDGIAAKMKEVLNIE
ncbi:MAG: hypothetical protein K9K66_14190 [Desulfarculaceae bacterium]|nr:hypothetical protein [Desulfarculaceae bacterium]MCF8073822.1 hypothetical protein [Desulfarculaceae bacterium]MCF8102802.1 hypothetical protein [Desulfarculaceae bacterium]MCF8116246.1 hypothetical protein [Desulfarculaceae bacterium]